MMMYYTYVLYSENDGQRYTGTTRDLRQRLGVDLVTLCRNKLERH